MVENLISSFFTGVGFFCNAIFACIGIAAETIQTIANLS